MKLLVDIGNSRIKWLLLADDKISERGAFQHLGHAPDTWGDQLWATLQRPEQVIIANVAGNEVATALNQWLQQAWSLEAQFARTEQSRNGVINGYQQPEKLGVDRWMALIGSRSVTLQSCVVIDCGTAATIDALNSDGQHLGGVILPGIRLMQDALYRNTDMAPQESGEVVFLGTNTRDCIWGGTIHALAAAIDRISTEMAAELDGEVCCLLAGGNANTLLPLLKHEYQLEPDLIFHGLRLIS